MHRFGSESRTGTAPDCAAVRHPAIADAVVPEAELIEPGGFLQGSPTILRRFRDHFHHRVHLRAMRDGQPRRRATETTAAFKTTEFVASAVAVVGVFRLQLICDAREPSASRRRLSDARPRRGAQSDGRLTASSAGGPTVSYLTTTARRVPSG
jgi:hypothetical protein